MTVGTEVRELLADAVHAYRGRPGERRLRAVTARLDEPLRVAIAGRLKAGKSTLLNALVGRLVAATDAGECTLIVTWYQHAEQPAAWADLRTGPPVPLGPATPPALPARLRTAGVQRLRVQLPAPWLRSVSLVDTPGTDSLTLTADAPTERFFRDASAAGTVDVVLYLMRQLHSSDVGFLRMTADADAGGTSPTTALGILSRADEIGGGADDALDHAHRIAADYRRDPRVRALVHTVVPLAGLLAEAAETLEPAEFTALAALAHADPSASDPLLVSASRFLDPARRAPVGPADRTALLRRLGLYGVRFGLRVLREDPAPTPERLRAALAEHSGLTGLQTLLAAQFTDRRDVLKADAALRVIDTVTREDPLPAGEELRRRMERIRVNAHEFREIRALTELRTTKVPGRAAALARLERVLGGEGTAAHTRLALAADATPVELAGAVDEEHAYWTQLSRNPLTAPELGRTADVAVRSCEVLAAALDEGA
ncbi:50S ribosome-binding GTPase [Streptomyces sp. TLI_235]|nr:GTPase [Streptomyces sp. TLI_235]PBC75970.1 50S ribosome-binding GTPase [Streptomyces sp. TLI_235]